MKKSYTHLVVWLDVHSSSHLGHRISHRILEAHLVKSEGENVRVAVHPAKHPHI